MAIAAINYNTGLDNAWSNVATFVPKFVIFLLILLIGWLIAKAITKALSAVLTRVGFDKVVERGGVKKALESSKYEPNVAIYERMGFRLVDEIECNDDGNTCRLFAMIRDPQPLPATSSNY